MAVWEGREPRPFTHPFQTAKGLGGIAAGAFQKLIPGEQSSEKNVDALLDFVKERYGGWENIKGTVAKDPAGFLADVAGLAMGGGGLAAKAAGTAGKLGSVASKVGKAGRVVDPARLASVVERSEQGKLHPRLHLKFFGLTTGAQRRAASRLLSAPVKRGAQAASYLLKP